MKTIDQAYERLLLSVARRSSGRGIILIALALYVGIGLTAPLALGWSVPWLIAANVFGTTMAGIVLLLWFAVRVQAAYRRQLVEWTTDLRLLDAEEFEWLVGELFRREGWDVAETGRQDAPDGAIDLLLTRKGKRTIVQCKRWTAKWVGVDDVRSFAGALLREGLSGRDGVFVTLSDFTEQARSEARTSGLTLVDHRDLYARVDKARRAEPCPVCGANMILDRSRQGWWFRCVAVGCVGKRDLGRSPARAIEFLLEPPA